MTILRSRDSAPATDMQNGCGLVKHISEAASFACTEQSLEIPGNVTVPQFLFNSQHFARLEHQPNAPWLVDSVSGRAIAGDEVRIVLECVSSLTPLTSIRV